jgi:U3 small nucleolar RNA-associated protein 14
MITRLLYNRPAPAKQRPPQQKAPRRDALKRHVIIREQVAPAVVALQPRDVPFPFTSIRDYETFIQQPLGADWNTPLAQQALIQPTVVTKVGNLENHKKIF